MKLNLDNLQNTLAWGTYRMPHYDIAAMREKTKAAPTWLHFGAGNIFRAFPAVLSQRLLTAGLTDTGLICCESFDEEIIDRCYDAFDNLSVAVTLYSDGRIKKEVVASVAEALKLSSDYDRVAEIFSAPSLQMVSFTITEKAYPLRDNRKELFPDVAADMKNGPAKAVSLIGRITALCLTRMHACGAPIALVSMDNCQNNSLRLRWSILEMAYAWKSAGLIDDAELAYLSEQVAFPLTMIDKITPHPDARIAEALAADGLEHMKPSVTAKGTVCAGFVNTEQPQYLLIEDQFPNGHPPLEQLGVIFTRRDIVEKTAQMKACTCLNPNDTTLAVYGCLLGYKKISDEMRDPDLVNLITRMSELEAMPMVRDPGVLDPLEYLHEALSVRYPNPFMPDTPQRIATDTSQKLAIRFGETLQGYYDSTLPKYRVCKLKYLPLALAGWLRYLLGVDDNGEPFELSPDPNLEMLKKQLAGITLGAEKVTEAQLYPILSSKPIFGVNLYEVGVADKVSDYFREMIAGPGAVRMVLHKYCAD